LSDLVERARTGDREAFGLLAATSIDALYAVASRIVQDPVGAEDAVQAAMLEAWRDLPSLRDGTRFEAWLHRIVVRACYKVARSQRAFDAGVRQVHVEPSTADRSESLADRDRLERAFRYLPVDQRAVVVLHHYRGMPLPEVAEVLGVPLGTVKSRLHYALRALRAAIEADDRVPVRGGRVA
jgi:RNA polymerase sigma-70 factor (ECF subfamily)